MPDARLHGHALAACRNDTSPSPRWRRRARTAAARHAAQCWGIQGCTACGQSVERRYDMTEKVRLDIPLLLPDVKDEADACVERLTSELQGREGLSEAHIVPAPVNGNAQLCIHYDPDFLPLARVRQLATSAGAAITGQYGHIRWDVDGLLHERRARAVGDQLRRLAGVIEAEASAVGAVRVEFDRSVTSEQDIRRALAELGVWQRAPLVVPASAASEEEEHEHGGIFGRNTELIFAVISGALLATGFGFEKLRPDFGGAGLTLYLLSYFFGGYYTLREAIDSLRIKRFEIDTLMLVAAAGAAALGAWAEGALLLFL